MNNNIMAKNIDRILSIGIALTAERDMDKLLDLILTETMIITNCDAGTLYIKEDDHLHFKILRNNKLNIFKGGAGDPIDLPPIKISESHVASYVTIHRRMENIADVYNSIKFDFTGPKKYDELTGYLTKSMLVIPLINNEDNIVGTLQLINALDSQGDIIPFAPEFEEIFMSLSSLAAISLSNMSYIEQKKALFQSLVEMLAAAIDERSKYNANHTRHVVEITRGFLKFLNKKHAEGKIPFCFTPNDEDQIIMAAWLHDIGKIITPLEIMDKSTRLGNKEPLINLRFETILSAEQIRFYKGLITEAEYNELINEINDARVLCERSNSGFPLNDNDIESIKSFGERTSITPSGLILNWLEPDEVESLAISFGTLTPKERQIMNEHVSITYRLLDKIAFSDEYRDVPVYAGGHHEKMNGWGYPNRLSEENLPIATRILTIADIFEALTATDRPYKKPMPLEKAFEILEKMATEGELDAGLVALFKEWKIV